MGRRSTTQIEDLILHYLEGHGLYFDMKEHSCELKKNRFSVTFLLIDNSLYPFHIFKTIEVKCHQAKFPLLQYTVVGWVIKEKFDY